MSTLEQLEVKTSKIKNDLQVLKAETFSYDEKRKKAETLKQQVDTIKIELQQKMGELNAQNDVNIQSEKEKAGQLLNSIEETTDLYNAILNNTATANQGTSENLGGNNNGEIATNDANNLPNPQKKEDEKGVIGKSWDWIGSQWSDVWDKEKWKTEGGMNLLRTAGFVATGVGAVTLAYKGIKKLFGWGKDEEDENEEEAIEKKSKKKKKKSFRKRPFGKFLKWTAIGVGGVLGINRLGKYFGWWGKEGATGRDSDKNKYESYDEFVKKPENKEKFENYEGLGDKVDSVYQEIYGRELKSGYEDELEMKKISEEQSKGTKFYKGIVPYCLDNQFKNVEGILGQNSSFKTALYDGLDGMINFVKNAGGGFLKLFSECYLEYLPSWAPFKGMAGSLGDKIDQWKIKNQNAEKEMQYFFRQSIRVQTYLFQKKDQLTKKLVKEASQTYGISEDDIRNDQDKFDKYITKNSQYQNFLNSPTHSAVTILEQNNIFDNHIDADLKELVTEIDKDRNKILGCKDGEKDIIESINEKKQKSETLDANDDKKLGEACSGMLNSMDDIIESAEDSARNIYSDLLRSGDANLREYLEKSGLDKMFESYKQILLAKKQELLSGKMSNEDKISLAETINSMLALKKEAELGKITIEKDYDENGNIIYRIPGFLVGSVKNLVKGVNKLIHGERGEGLSYLTSSVFGVGIIITAGGVVRGLSAGKRGIAKAGAVITTLPVSVPGKLLYKGATHIKPVRDFGHKINPLKYRGEKGAELLLKDLKEGKISLEHAGEIIDKKCNWRFTGSKTEALWKKTFGSFEGSACKNAAFDALIKSQPNIDSGYLREIKNEDGLYDEIIKKWDTSEEIRQAVLKGKSTTELKKVVEVIGDAKKTLSAFEESIDNAIDQLKRVRNPKAYESYIKHLNDLKANYIKELKGGSVAKEVEDEMKAFTKFINEGFDAKTIPELKKLFTIGDELKSGEKLGERLKVLFNSGKYDEFKSLLRDPKRGKAFKKVGINNVDDIVKSFDNVLIKGASKFGPEGVKLLASFAKVLAKFKV